MTMDPNETLRRIRELRSQPVSDADYLDLLQEVMELYNALDEWLSKGGFPPDDWGYAYSKLGNHPTA
jgi:hypothetical protein